jgi:hypothetical protein
VNLGATRSRLAAVTKELSLQWGETKNYWRDAKSLEFENRYISELLARVDKAVTVIEKLDALLDKVKKDCE